MSKIFTRFSYHHVNELVALVELVIISLIARKTNILSIYFYYQNKKKEQSLAYYF
jgi:hypothetical protein